LGDGLGVEVVGWVISLDQALILVVNQIFDIKIARTKSVESENARADSVIFSKYISRTNSANLEYMKD
jgi:hypothetical protein